MTYEPFIETAPIENTIFLINKQIYEEVSSIFYPEYRLRFNSHQFRTLVQLPRVFLKLRRLEMEDIWRGQRDWVLEPALKFLANAPHLEDVVIGHNVVYASRMGKLQNSCWSLGMSMELWQAEDDVDTFLDDSQSSEMIRRLRSFKPNALISSEIAYRFKDLLLPLCITKDDDDESLAPSSDPTRDYQDICSLLDHPKISFARDDAYWVDPRPSYSMWMDHIGFQRLVPMPAWTRADGVALRDLGDLAERKRDKILALCVKT